MENSGTPPGGHIDAFTGSENATAFSRSPPGHNRDVANQGVAGREHPGHQAAASRMFGVGREPPVHNDHGDGHVKGERGLRGQTKQEREGREPGHKKEPTDFEEVDLKAVFEAHRANLVELARKLKAPRMNACLSH